MKEEINNNNDNNIKRGKKIYLLLILLILTYFIIYFYNKTLFFNSFNFAINILREYIKIIIIIFIFILISNLFINPQFIMKHLGEKGIKKWIYVIILGLLSGGPVYFWFPLLSDLHKKGLKYGLIACFLYNRAIKIPLLSIAIMYFGLKYIIILTILMIIISVIQGMLINKLLEE